MFLRRFKHNRRKNMRCRLLMRADSTNTHISHVIVCSRVFRTVFRRTGLVCVTNGAVGRSGLLNTLHVSPVPCASIHDLHLFLIGISALPVYVFAESTKKSFHSEWDHNMFPNSSSIVFVSANFPSEYKQMAKMLRIVRKILI